MVTYHYRDPLVDHDRQMRKLAIQHEQFKVKLPPGRSGAWAVEPFHAHDPMMLLRAWRDGRPIPEGEYTRLWNDQAGTFMTDTPAELQDAYMLIRMARGHLLITGLGIGMIPRALLMDRPHGPTPIEKITIVEREEDVIKLVGPSMSDPRIEIVHGDAFSWEPPADAVFDWAWHDIWPDMSTDYLPEIRKLRRRYSGFMADRNRQLVWGEESL